MATSIDTATDDWAVVPMTANPAFWQVFVRPANSSTWQLVTPPGVQSTGGIVAAAGGAASSLTVAVRPTQDLLFSPTAATSDSGSTWSTDAPINAAVAASPDALSAYGSKLVALLSNGAIDESANAGATWSTLAKPGAIAASAAGKACGGTVRVTSVSFGPAGTDVLAGGTCGTGGTTAMFSYSPGTGWQRVSLPVSGQVVQLTGESALVLGKSGLSALWGGSTTSAAWSASAALPFSGTITASGTLAGSGAWVLLSGGRAATISAPASTTGAAPQWLLLPPVPAHTTVLASGPGGATEALAASGAALTVWQLAPNATVWSKVQTIDVPIQYGSSS
jgi:hypothetical protein